MSSVERPPEERDNRSSAKSAEGASTTAEEDSPGQARQPKKADRKRPAKITQKSKPNSFLEGPTRARTEGPEAPKSKGMARSKRESQAQPHDAEEGSLGKRQAELLGLAYYSLMCSEILQEHEHYEKAILDHFDSSRRRLQQIANRF